MYLELFVSKELIESGLYSKPDSMEDLYTGAMVVPFGGVVLLTKFRHWELNQPLQVSSSTVFIPGAYIEEIYDLENNRFLGRVISNNCHSSTIGKIIKKNVDLIKQ